MRIILIALIVLVAVAAGFFVLQMAEPEPQVNTVVEEKPQMQTVDVLVARKSIPIGTEITEQMIDRQPWPSHLVLSGFIVADSPEANIIGMVTRSNLQEQEPIGRYKLANPNDANFIAAALPAGKRALTLQIDAISGVAGYIYPGDHVDVVMTHRIPYALSQAQQSSSSSLGVSSTAPIPATPAGFAETILRNIKVLAVEIRGLRDFQSNAEQQQSPQAPTNLTLELTPEQVQAVRLAEKNGTVSLALRSLKDSEDVVVVGTKLNDLTSEQVNADEFVSIIRGVEPKFSAVPLLNASGRAGNQLFVGSQ